MKYFVKDGDTLLQAPTTFGRLEVLRPDGWAPFPTSRVDIWDDLTEIPREHAAHLAHTLELPAVFGSVTATLREVKMYSDDQPRDAHGRFGAGIAGPHAEHAGLKGLMGDISKPDGGFTYQPVTGDQPKTGYALSIYKGRERTLDAKTMTPADLVKFAKDNNDLLKQKDNYFGAWHNPSDGKVYLDVSKVASSEKDAERLGRANHQLAYFDLSAGKSVEIDPSATRH